MQELNFNFKGERTYIQGPDVYNALLQTYPNLRLFELSFHQLMTQNILLSQGAPKDEKDLYFIARFKSAQELNFKNELRIFGLKNPNSKPSKSIIYEEEKIISKSSLDLAKQEITLSCPSGFSFMEEIIALNKHLLLNVFSEQKSKWYFAKLNLNDEFKEKYPLKLRFKSHFNFLLTKSEIFIANDRGGGCFFGRARK